MVNLGGWQLEERSYPSIILVTLRQNGGDGTPYEMDFKVEPLSTPPTNIHVLIGRNGVGKTHLLDNMVNALVKADGGSSAYGYFSSPEQDKGERIFANLVLVSFSAFDSLEPLREEKDKTKGMPYTYIGLKRVPDSPRKLAPTKTPTLLKREFATSLEGCFKLYKRDIWRRTIKMLYYDAIFKDSEVEQKLANLDMGDMETFKSTAEETFQRFSSGHKIVLLTITRLIESIEEKTLVLLDEPEAHLHPPLLAAFVRVLSHLLVQRNGVRIIATHSPVVLQEVPASCVWNLRRSGNNRVAERLNNQSFAENVGILTSDVFGLEVD